MQERERILVTVRTYPTPSTGNRETVCTGGITIDGEWRRLYPVPLRYLPAEQRFRTWDVIGVDVKPPVADSRPESRRPHLPSLCVVDRLEKWAAKCEWVQRTCFPSMKALIGAGRSLGPVSVQEVVDLKARKVDVEWDPRRQAKLNQMMLFDQPKSLEKMPLEFRFVWHDLDGQQHESLVISWEMAETWRKYRRRYTDPLQQMKEKFLADCFGPKRLPAFFMGNHSRFRKTFMVCGWFIPPRREVKNEFLW